MSHRNVRDIVANDSQNFCLRVSQSSTFIEDMQDVVVDNKQKEDDVIVISDSSCNSSPKQLETPEWKARFLTSKNKKKLKYQKSFISETSSESEENINSPWRYSIRCKDNFLGRKYINKNDIQVNKSFYTSDETTTKKYDTSPSKERGIYNVNQTNKTVTPSHTVRSESSTVRSKLNKFFIYNTPQDNTRNVKLTKEDANKIFRNIKDTRIIYNSPREQKETNVIINESTDVEDIIHPAISSRNNIEKNHYDENSDVIETSLKDYMTPLRMNLLKSHKVQVNNFSNPSREENLYRPLSDRKKTQIAEWLMKNLSEADVQSDTSCSNIPASNINSVESGNSSLERLELIYETPNNRKKINKVHTGEKQTIPQIVITNCDKSIKLLSTEQPTLDKSVKKCRNNNIVFRTPNKSKFLSKKQIDENISLSSIENTSDDPDIKEYKNILDKLYGNSWRNKADLLLPKTEPRKKLIPMTNKLVQTERKIISRNRDYMINSNKPNSERKTQRINSKRMNSFINDESSTDDSESIYHTALTNIRSSTNSTMPKQYPKEPKPKESAITQRLLSICDIETEDELNSESNSNSKKSLRGKKLSFSDDKSSSTSEFDPGDFVPPKLISKKVTKTVYPSKTKSKTGLNVTSKSIAPKSFLVSLSNTVPINNAHPNAKRYRIDYKNNKEELCRELYKLYNEKVFENKLPKEIPIEWNIRMRGTAGYCYNKKSVKSLTGTVKSSRIVLATKILDTPDRLRDTLIHEMCHAATWLINDVSDGHGPFWTGWANKAMKIFPELPSIRRCHDYEIKTKFTYRCTECGYSIGRHSKSLDIERKRCGRCFGKFELLVNKTTKSGTLQVQTPKKEPSGFALYVKQNYGSVKKEKCNIKHAEVMKILGQQFSTMKIAKKNELQNLDVVNNPEPSD